MDSEREHPEQGPPAPFWRSWSAGERVIVRYRLTQASEGEEAGPSLTDALGELVSVDDDGVRVLTRRGEVSVPGSAITLGKRVPPAPERRPGRAPRQEAQTDP